MGSLFLLGCFISYWSVRVVGGIMEVNEWMNEWIRVYNSNMIILLLLVIVELRKE